MKYIDQEQFCARYWAIREAVQADPEYVRLTSELDAMEPRWEAIASTLSETDRADVERYILLRENRSLRMLEFACEQDLTHTDA